MFSNLLHISFIYHQVEKENQKYLEIFTNLYTKTLQKDLVEFLAHVNNFKKDLLNNSLKIQHQINQPKKVYFKNLYTPTINNFLLSSPSAKKIEITYSNNLKDINVIKSEKIKLSNIDTVKTSSFKVKNEKENLFLKKQFNKLNDTEMKIYPIIRETSLKTSFPSVQEQEEIFLPISYFSRNQNGNWLIIKVFFEFNYIRDHLKDFLDITNSSIKDLILIWQDGQPLTVINTPNNKKILYDIPIYKLKNLEKVTLSVNDLNINQETNTFQPNSMKNFLQRKNFKLEETDQFFGILFEVNLSNLYEYEYNFFAILSILIINIAFIFLAIYYGISYYFVQNIHRILEQGSLKFTIQFDPQTGVFTRSSIQEVAIRLINMEQNFVLSILDIDFFKKINDKFGHLVGDTVLLDLCEKIEKQFQCWEKDFPEGKFSLGRWGGEEFLLIMCLEKSNQLVNLLNTLQNKISQPSLTKDLPSYTVSLGACCVNYEKMHINSLDIFIQLFKKADLALYEAKRKGKNQVVFKNFKGSSLYEN